jgi:hypothetical protein
MVHNVILFSMRASLVTLRCFLNLTDSSIIKKVDGESVRCSVLPLHNRK